MEEVGERGIESPMDRVETEERESEREEMPLPVDLISQVIGLATPRDACRSAAVSTRFKLAASSNIVWEQFLPPDYESILSMADHPFLDHYSSLSKKDLYFQLCNNPVIIDGSKMSFGLEKESGAKCFMASARSMRITWGDTPRYWKWTRRPDTRFMEVAKLKNVCWLEFFTSIRRNMLSIKTTYVGYLIFKLDRYSYGLIGNIQSTYISLDHGGSYELQHYLCLQPKNIRQHVHENDDDDDDDDDDDYYDDYYYGDEYDDMNEGLPVGIKTPQAREDGWMEIELGEFYNEEDGQLDGELEFRFMGSGGQWKRGLVIQGVDFRPKN